MKKVFPLRQSQSLLISSARRKAPARHTTYILDFFLIIKNFIVVIAKGGKVRLVIFLPFYVLCTLPQHFLYLGGRKYDQNFMPLSAALLAVPSELTFLWGRANLLCRLPSTLNIYKIQHNGGTQVTFQHPVLLQ